MVFKLFLALSYACIFWYVCSKRPIIALASAFAFSPFAFSVLGDSVNASLSDVNIALCIPLLIIGVKGSKRNFSIGPLTAPVYVYLTLCLVSSAVASQWQSALTSWLQMALYFIISIIVFANFCKPKELALIPYYAVGVGVIWAFIGIGTGFNFMGAAKNAFGASLSGTLMIVYSLYAAWEHRPSHKRIKSEGKWLAIAGVIIFVALIMTLSRGAILGTVVGIVVMSAYMQSYRLLLRGIAYMTPIMVIIWVSLPPQLKTYAINFDSSSAYNIELRYKSVNIAETLFMQDPIWGSGIGLRKMYDATNLVWSTLAETGILGLLALASIYIVFYRWTWGLCKVIKPRDPYFIFISMSVGLMTARLTHGMVDHYWSRGVITMVWASVGMVLCLSRVYAAKTVRTASVPHMEQPLPSRQLPRPVSRHGRNRRLPHRRSTLKRTS